MGSTGRRIVVISPHFDDAPLSLGESMRRGALAGNKVRVRIAFGRTNWTTWFHPTLSRARLVSLWRAMEESLASLIFGYRWTAARWDEVVLRSGDLDASKFVDVDADLSDDPLVSELAIWLRDVCSAPFDTRDHAPAELILAPAGIGGHRDHMLLAFAAARIIDDVGTPIGFYEDRPYVAYVSPEGRLRHMARLDTLLSPTDVSPPIRRSTQWMARMAYPSQMSDYFIEAMEADRDSNDSESIWFRPGDRPDWF